MASIVDSTFDTPQPAQNAGAPAAAFTQGNAQGIDAGLALAHGQQQSQLVGQQLQDMQTQATIQKGAYAMNLMDKVQQTQNPKVRGLYLDNYNDFAQKNGQQPLSDSVYDYIKNVPDSNAILSKLVQQYPHVASDPTQAVQFVSGFAQAVGMPLADAEKSITPLLQAGQTAMYKNMMMMNQNRKMDQGDERIGIQTAKMGGNVLEKSMNDPDVQNANVILNGVQKGQSIINKGLADYQNGKGTVTWGQLHEITGDLAGVTSVKPSNVVAASKQEGIEADIPKFSAFLGQIDKESNQNPSKTVPVGTLNQLKDQFNTIGTVMGGIHDHEVASRLNAGVISKEISPSVADTFFKTRRRGSAQDVNSALISGYDNSPGQGTPAQAATTQTATPPTPAASPALQNPQAVNLFKQLKGTGKSYQQLSPVQQQAISQKDYNSL